MKAVEKAFTTYRQSVIAGWHPAKVEAAKKELMQAIASEINSNAA
jgi:hypothetical protein